MSIGIVCCPALLAAVDLWAADIIGGLTSRRVSPWAVALAGQLAGGSRCLAVGLSLPAGACLADFGGRCSWLGSAVGTAFLYPQAWRGAGCGRSPPCPASAPPLVPVFVGVSMGEPSSTLTWIGVLVAPPALSSSLRGHALHRPVGGGIRTERWPGSGFGCCFVALAQGTAVYGALHSAANPGRRGSDHPGGRRAAGRAYGLPWDRAGAGRPDGA